MFRAISVKHESFVHKCFLVYIFDTSVNLFVEDFVKHVIVCIVSPFYKVTVTTPETNTQKQKELHCFNTSIVSYLKIVLVLSLSMFACYFVQFVVQFCSFVRYDQWFCMN